MGSEGQEMIVNGNGEVHEDGQPQRKVTMSQDVTGHEGTDSHSKAVPPRMMSQGSIHFGEKYQGRKVHGAGKFLLRLGIYFGIPLMALVALTFINVLFGVIPLGSPNKKRIGYLNAALFYGALRLERPFRRALFILPLVYAAEVAVLAPIIRFVGVFDLLGLAALAICYVVTISGLWIERSVGAKTAHIGGLAWQFTKCTIAITIWILVLVGYVFGFRFGGSTLQKIFPPIRQILVFIFRKYILHQADLFPLPIAMLMSGFWPQAINDFFQVLAYPITKKPSTYAVIGATNAASLFANLAFLTPQWFRFRVWVKEFLKNVFCCRFPLPDSPAPIEEDIADERGHTNNRPGYLRRQWRFFLFKVLSQATANFMYVSFSPVLRYGLNKEYNLISELEINQAQWRRSMIYSAANAVFAVTVGLLGCVIVRWKLPIIYKQINREIRKNFVSLNWLGYLIAIVSYSALLTISIIIYHMKIWYAWSEVGQTADL